MSKILVMFKKIMENCKNLLILGRYNNPAGAFLLMWPCYWGVLSNINEKENLFSTLFLFTLGSFIMRGAGCCINDIFDKDFDKKVKRTVSRPLASGAVNVKEATIFTIFQLFLGLIVVLQFDPLIVLWSFIIIPLVVIYPLLKRITSFPQIALGLAFNWGVILGSINKEGGFNFFILILYFAGVFLTIAYDTIYGFQDIKDDRKLGLKSMAIFLEKKKNVIFYLYMISFILFLTFFIINFTNKILALFCGSIIFIIFNHQYKLFNKNKSLMKIFKTNVLYGGLISVLIAIQNYF